MGLMIYREHGYLSYYLAFFIASISFTDLLNKVIYQLSKIASLESGFISFHRLINVVTHGLPAS